MKRRAHKKDMISLDDENGCRKVCVYKGGLQNELGGTWSRNVTPS